MSFAPREAVMVIFSSTATVVQVIKIAVFFLNLGLPAVHGTGVELSAPAPVAAIHDIDRPPSTPRRDRS